MKNLVDKVGYTSYDTHMPSQRASNKKQFTAAFTKDELAQIDKMAKELGITRTEFLRRAAMEAVQAELKTKKEN